MNVLKNNNEQMFYIIAERVRVVRLKQPFTIEVKERNEIVVSLSEVVGSGWNNVIRRERERENQCLSEFI